MLDRIHLITIPSGDTAFGAYARSVLADLPADLPPPSVLDEFQRRLQTRYPSAVVRPREPLADVGTSREPVWYATNRAYRSRIWSTLEIAAPRDLVFATYVGRVAEWQTAVRLEQRHVAPALVGSEWSATWAFLGRTTNGLFRIVAADPPHSVRFEASGMGIRVWYDTSFVPTPGGTMVRVVGDYDVPDGIVPTIVDRLFMERGIQRQIDHAHDAFVALCVQVAAERAAG
jgi:hypothetical protein